MPELREAICNYYKVNSGATIDPENVMVFAGGRPALMAVLLFLRSDITIKIAEAEYAGFYGILDKLNKKTEIIASNESNNFRPSNAAYMG
jgi:aspartate/methionine/tyrosine aminotransferase